MSTDSHLQIYQMLTSLFVTISKRQLIIDSIKQVLTTFPLFHPLVLFNYLTNHQPLLLPKHLIKFLQQNNTHAKLEDINIIFAFQGAKNHMNYSTFLKMIYPYNMYANRQIQSIHLKNYHATSKLHLTQQILACFYLLLTQHIQLINKIQIQKQDSLARISKDKINKVLRNIKKLTQKSLNHCDKNPDIISGLELVYFIKNFTDVQDSSLFYLLRRLGTDHLGSIHIEKLQEFVKPWKKKSSLQFTQNEDCQENFIEQTSNHKRFNEQKYRKQLNSQLQRSVSAKKSEPTKCKPRKQGSIKIKQGQKNDKILQESARSISVKNTPIKEIVNKSGKKKDKQEWNIKGVGLFVRFLEVFLKNSLEIQRLKMELNRGNKVNYLRIFKKIDNEERGVIERGQLQRFYKEMGGVSVSINFNVLIEGYSEPGHNWLTYSEFCEIFKPSIQRSQRAAGSSGNAALLQHTTNQGQQLLMSQIIYLSLVKQEQLLQIRRQFTRGDLFQLFHKINKQNSGYINYQQLKMFLQQIGFKGSSNNDDGSSNDHNSNNGIGGQISMYELMLILKRLDKCKNGVVSENEFVDYFLVKM